MAIYTSNVNRVTGLSGVDTESMIDKMMKAESAKYEKLEKDEILLSWRQEAYREVIGKLQKFQEKWFGIDKTQNIGYNSAWNKYDFSVTDKTGKESSAITINSSVNSGKYNISVSQVAQTESITGNATIKNKITTGKTADEIAKSIKSLSASGKQDGSLTFNFDLDGVSKDITITHKDLEDANLKGTTDGEKLVEVFNKKLDEAFGKEKVKVKKNATTNKLEITAGAGNNLTIKDGKSVDNGTTVKHIGVLDETKEGKYELTIEANGKTYTVTAEFKKDEKPEDRIKKVIDSFKKAKDSNGKEVDISKDIHMSVEQDGKDLVFKNNSRDEEYTIKSSKFAGDTANDITTGQTMKPTYSLHYLGLDSSKSTATTENTYLKDAFGEEYSKFFNDNKNADDVLEMNFGGKTISIKENETIESFMNKVNASDSKIKMSFNQITGRFKMESTESGANGTINITENASTKGSEIDFIKNFVGIDLEDKINSGNYQKGQDAIFKVDGVKTTRPTNEINMNGLKFTINSITSDDVTIGATTNDGDTLKMVKDFVEDYNKLVSELDEMVNKPREKAGKYEYYEPLLKEEKDAMSEDEIKKWEEKAKKGLLHRDPILTDLLQDLRKIPYTAIDIGGGKSMSLYEIGIGTGKNYNSNKLEIDENKLKKAINERGDDVRKLFTSSAPYGTENEKQEGIASKMKSAIDNMVGREGMLRKKAGIKDTTSEANNLLTDNINELRKRKSAEKERLYAKEMQYFNMFSKMEAMMNKQNSQMSMLMGILGQA